MRTAPYALPPQAAGARSRGERVTERESRRAAEGEVRDGYLRRRTVRERTRILYSRAYSSTCAAAGQDLAKLQPAQLDGILEKVLNDGFFEGDMVGETKYKLFGTAWATGTSTKDLPKAKAVLRGSEKQNPPASREPVTWQEALLLADCLAASSEDGSLMAACTLLMQFDTYARPAEILQLTPHHCTAPSAFLERQSWSVTFFPGDLDVFSKTNTRDDTVQIGDLDSQRFWLNSILALLVRRTAPSTMFSTLILSSTAAW